MVRLSLLFMVMFGLTACGSGAGKGPDTSIPPQTVSGVALAGAPLTGTITLEDSSTPTKQLTAISGNDGSFTLTGSGLTAPFLIKGVGTSGQANYTLYSLATSTGTCNVTPLTDLAVTMANGGQDPTALFSTPSPAAINAVSAKIPAAITSIQTQLAPLFAQVGVSPVDFITDSYSANRLGIDLLLYQITITTSNGYLSIVNSSSGEQILPSTSIASGTFSGAVNASALGLYIVSGSVTTPSGTALSGVTVTLAGSSSATVTTGPSGTFSFAGIANGSYTLRGSRQGYTFPPIQVAVSNGNMTGEDLTGSNGAALVSIAVTPANPHIAIGATQQFTATGTYSDASTQNLTATVAWSSSNTSAVTVATGGLATMAAAGSAQITATSGGIAGTTTLTTATGSIAVTW